MATEDRGSLLADLELAIEATIGPDGMVVTDAQIEQAFRKVFYPHLPAEADVSNHVAHIKGIIVAGPDGAMHDDWKGRLWADTL